MQYIFRLLRMYLKFRRSLFKGELPHWVRDLVELIKYVNLIGPLITLSAITLSADHFFRRLPQYISRNDSWFGSPVKFFTQGITLMAALSFFIGENLWRLLPQGDSSIDPNYTSSSVYWNVLLYALLAPVFLPFVSVVLAPFALLLRLVSSGFSLTPVSLKGVWQECFMTAEVMLIPAAPSTYARLNWSRFFWSLCYYDVYFFLMAVIVLTPLTLFVAAMIDSIFLHDYYLASKVLYLTFVGTVYCGPVLFIVLRPYVSLLRAAVARPTKIMIAAEYSAIGVILSDVVEIVRKDGWGSVDIIFGAFESFIATCERAARKELRLTTLMSDETRKLYLAERSEVLSKILSTAQLRVLYATHAPKGNEEFVRLLDRIDMISHSDTTSSVGRPPAEEAGEIAGAK